jgi:hypothetical protein
MAGSIELENFLRALAKRREMRWHRKMKKIRPDFGSKTKSRLHAPVLHKMKGSAKTPAGRRGGLP